MRQKKSLKDKNISDEESEKIRENLYALGEIIFEKYQAERKNNDGND